VDEKIFAAMARAVQELDCAANVSRLVAAATARRAG
jgi:hypothetical protein